jgi:hypothetical protein
MRVKAAARGTTKIAPIHKMAGVCLPYIHAYSRFYLSLLSDCFVKEASQALSFLFCLSNTNTNTKLLYLAVDCCRRFDIDIDIDIAAARLAGRQAGRNTIRRTNNQYVAYMWQHSMAGVVV